MLQGKAPAESGRVDGALLGEHPQQRLMQRAGRSNALHWIPVRPHYAAVGKHLHKVLSQ